MTDFRINVIVDPRAAKTGLRSVGSELDRVEKRATKTGSALKRAFTVAAVGLAVVRATSLMAGFGQEMSTVGAIAQATGNEFTQLTEEAERLGITTRFSALEAAQGMTFLARAGFEAAEVLATTEAALTLAQSGALGLAEAADIASNVLQGFRLETSQAGRVVDVLSLAANSSNTNVSQLGQAMKFAGPVAAGLGVSVEEAAAAVGALSNAGLQASLAGTGLRRVMSELESPSNKTVEIFRSMGLSADEVAISQVGLTGALQALASAGIDTGTALEVFGDRGGPAFEVLSSSIPDVVRMTGELRNAEGSAKRVADAMDDNLNGALLAVRSAFQGVILAFGEAGAADNLENSMRSLAGALRFLAANMDTLFIATQAAFGAFLTLKLVPVIASFITLQSAISAGTVVVLGSAAATHAKALADVEATVANIAHLKANIAALAGEAALAKTIFGTNVALGEQVALEAALTTQTALLVTAEEALIIAQAQAAAGTTIFGRAFLRLGKVIVAHPIGAAVVAVGALAVGLLAFVPTVETAADRTKRFRGELEDLAGTVDRLEGLRAEREILIKVGGSASELQSNLSSQSRAIEAVAAELVKKGRDGIVTVDLSNLIKTVPDAPQELIDDLVAAGQQMRDEALAALEGTDAVDQGFFDRLIGIDTGEIERTAAQSVAGNVNLADALDLVTQAAKRAREAEKAAADAAPPDAERVAALEEVAAGLQNEATMASIGAAARERLAAQLKIEGELREKNIELEPDERRKLARDLEGLQAITDRGAVLESIIGPQEEYGRTLAALDVLQEEGTISAAQYTAALADAKDTLGGFDQIIAAQNAELEHERELIGATRAEREIANEVFRIEQQLRRDLTDEEKAAVVAGSAEKQLLADKARLLEEIQGPQHALLRTQAALKSLYDDSTISLEQYNAALLAAEAATGDYSDTASGGFKAGIDQVKKGLADVSGQVKSGVVDAFGEAEDALLEFVQTGQLSFTELADSIIADIQRIIIKQLLLLALNVIAPGAGSALGFATGGGGGGAPAGKAAGGPVGAGETFLVGEEGPEIFTPAKTGTIVPAGETAAIMQAAATPQPAPVEVSVEVKPQIVNVNDPDELAAAIDSGELDEPIINRISRNRRAVKGALA